MAIKGLGLAGGTIRRRADGEIIPRPARRLGSGGSGTPRCLYAAAPAFHRLDVAAGAKTDRDIDDLEVVDSESAEQTVQPALPRSSQKSF